MIIYKLENKINEKIYIGQTIFTLNERFKGHLKKIKNPKQVITYAIKKYGKENFIKEIVEECLTKEELNDREKYWIKFYNSTVPYGYNMSLGGDGGLLFHTEKTKKLLSKLKVGFRHTEETKLKISKAMDGENHPMFGKYHTEKSKKNMSENSDNRGKLNPMYGKTHTNEAKEKIRLARKLEIDNGTWINPSTCLSEEENKKRIHNISESLKGIPSWNKGLVGNESHTYKNIDKQLFIDMIQNNIKVDIIAKHFNVSKSTIHRRIKEWQLN